MMMPSTILNKIKLILALIMLTATTGCSMSNNNAETGKNTLSLGEAVNSTGKDSDKEYIITFRNSSDFYVLKGSQPENVYWSNEFSFPVIQLRNMQDTVVTEITNENIEKAMTSWISGKVVKPSSVDLSIYCHSEKYLSFVNSFKYASRRVDYIKDYITIDMKTGKRVMLNDLVEVNEAFVEHIQEDNIAKASEYSVETLDTDEEKLWEYLKEMEPSDLLKKLEECSLTQEQVIEAGYAPIDETIGPLVFRNSFFLQNNTLVIVLDGDLYITLCLDDITDFLKVEKW